MDRQSTRYVLVLALLCVAVFIASGGGFQNPDWNALLGRVSTSVLSTVVRLFLLWGINRQPEIDSERLALLLEQTLERVSGEHFARVDRNSNMGERYWLGLIDELETCREPVWFVGTRLAWWQKARYRTPLRKKLLDRLKNVSGAHRLPDRAYLTFVFLADPDAIPLWKAFFQSIIDELTSAKEPTEKEELARQYWSKIVIRLLPQDLAKYSLVLCGTRLGVTQYISLGRSDDSPTLDVRYSSAVRQLYLDDLERLEVKLVHPEKRGSKSRPGV